MAYLRIPSRRHPLIAQMLADVEQARQSRPHLPGAMWDVATAAIETLCSWRVPARAALAAGLAPFLEHELVAQEVLAAKYGHEAVKLALELCVWHSAHPVSEQTGPEPTLAQRSALLRILFRQAYLDLPGLAFILLLLANHHARLMHPQLGTSRLARETEAVWIPFLEMLGMWALRRLWLERSVEIQFPNEVGEIARQIESEETISKRKRAKIPGDQPTAADKENAFGILKQKILEQARAQQKRPGLRIGRITWSPEYVFRRFRQGKPSEEAAHWIGIRILCRSATDCYRVLGIVHLLGTPIAPRFAEWFEDHIAAPQPNGYRALHTAINYRHKADKSDQLIQVEFRILTPSMYRLNETGVIATQYHNPGKYQAVATWWNRLEILDDRLARYTGDSAKDTLQFLRQHDIGSRSQPIYSFTPFGEIVFIDQNSTALDLAYRLHTELGDHAEQIEINHEVVPYHYPTQNGDLVRVKYNASFQGPDLAWLGIAMTRHARAKIRRGLARRAHAVHKGRAAVESVLINRLQYYQRTKHYHLTATTSRLEAFLNQTASARRLPNIETLYDRIVSGSIAAERLVHQFISTELAPAIVNANGENLPYALHQIDLCDVCCPVPGEPLVAFERRKNGAVKGISIHCQIQPKCVRAPRATDEIEVRWAEQSGILHKPAILFEIQAEDRRGLLRDVLSKVYDQPGAYLYQLEAHAHNSGTASLELVVEGDALRHLIQLHAELASVASVRQVFPMPLSPAQRLALTPHLKELSPNPYTAHEVYDRVMFYDREEQISDLLEWLREAPPTRWLVLHGQRRVGKTSLVRYLMHHVLPPLSMVTTIFIDLQSISQWEPRNLSRAILQAVFTELQSLPPEPSDNEEPAHWLSRGLRNAAALMGRHRLLIVLDEFGRLLEDEQAGLVHPALLANLRAVMSDCRNLNWLLVIPDAQFLDRDCWGNAASLLMQATPLAVPHLDAAWARKLALEPTQRCGLQYQDQQVLTGIIELTDGNPFFTQMLCYYLVDHVMRLNRTVINQADLESAASLMMIDGNRYFDHFLRPLDDQARLVLSVIADMADFGKSVDLKRVIVVLNKGRRRLASDRVMQITETLARLGVIMEDASGQEIRVRIPVGMFHRWIKHTLPLAVPKHGNKPAADRHSRA
jgi:guanosine-3',5'-bis(diphosphate) 3'-pyrophosphohydrolase